MSPLSALAALGLEDQLQTLSASALKEFERTSDFIWKAPRLIEHERRLELAKLNDYFPNDPDLRQLRWKLESHKLDRTFPYLIAVGNLFSALSLFETYLLLLAETIQPHTTIQLQDIEGQGMSRLFKFFRSTGVNIERLPLYKQVQAAIKIRNCLTHASGMLTWSRESKDLRAIQQTGAYLSPEHRKMRIERQREFDEVRVVASKLGDRLAIDNQYAHILSVYLSGFFTELCGAVNRALSRVGAN